MSGQTWWVVVIVAVIVAAVVGFFVGRLSAGSRERVAELESELERRKEEVDRYKREVETHFDRTASLFVSMAGSYRELFEHLSEGYEKLAEGAARERFKDRVSALLLDAPGRDAQTVEVESVSGLPDEVPARNEEAPAAAAGESQQAVEATSMQAGEVAAPADEPPPSPEASQAGVEGTPDAHAGASEATGSVPGVEEPNKAPSTSA
jgi:uncharacterized membrane-anchored protein YhcB (DUF1043 family)